MIPQQTFENYPVFGGNATKVKPDDNKYANGFQQSDVLPAEWMNWAWNKNSKGIADLNTGAASMEAEINNVLSEAGITPDASASKQLYKAVQKNNGCIITPAATPAIITNAPSIEAGNTIKIMFGADVTGSNTTDGLLISYNGANKAVKVCKNGALADLTAHEITSGTFKYIQAYRTLEFVYDGVYFIVAGNPVVLSGADYTIYADGQVGNEIVGEVKPLSTRDIPYGWVEANGQSLLRSDYPKLFEKYNTQYNTDDTSDPNRKTLLEVYGYADSTHFNVPDYREVVLVGIGTNGTDTIATHDEFTLGKFKDDQIQNHMHNGSVGASGGSYGWTSGNFSIGATTGTISTGGRQGGTTRTKEKGVKYIIKAL